MAPERTNSENSSGNYLRNVPNNIVPPTSSILPSTVGGPLTTGGPFTTTITTMNQSVQNLTPQPPPPPPVPPRQPVAQQNYSGYNSYGPNYYYGGFNSNYGNQYRGFNGGFGGSGQYSSYIPYIGYNNYGSFSGGYSGNAENRFFHYIEANTRPTFQSIETVLHAFSSITMLLESTYCALTNSFRAILSLAESVGKLRSTINQLFSTFAMIRFVKWLYRKIAHSAGFHGSRFSSHSTTTDEELWDKSLAKIVGGDQNANNSSFWSGLLMFSVFFAIPYMLHKIITSSMKTGEAKATAAAGFADPKTWYESEEPAHVATVLYDFNPVNNSELGVRAGQKICLAPKSLQPKQMPGWCRATDNVNVGLVPCNYIKILGQLKKVKKTDETIQSIPSARRDEQKSCVNENPDSDQQQQQQQQRDNSKIDPEESTTTG